ncbi:hypothetical protein AAFC00_000164 [Neodothiora populina]|uniref:PH domain-containing protein n=1 Tax=Neodothiora populina TaxID=2781224 RepID=A0ABR3P1Z5_9PEZI
MPRSRVLSFMSAWGGPKHLGQDQNRSVSSEYPPSSKKIAIDTSSSSASNSPALDQSAKDSPSPSTQQRFRSDSRSESRASRPMSMIQTYQPPLMDIAGDTLPELQPIFTFLNSHSNKLYQEGYFLKLHDLDSRGRPSADRVWNECFAQLVGTVLSLWDAAALDAAGEEGEVVPTFVNLGDASIKMIESLPMNGSAGGTLQNVLSISTAANNRYLLHFNSLNSLTQWTAGIRLAIYEHATLQEAYTGSLIAGKGRLLNNIRVIMERSKFKSEDWARVRFGAGTPWRRCWCVITPPDEKEYQKAQKTLKKRDAYDRKVVVPKGDIKFYDTRKVTKKTRPIATISEAYAAYAIYPQSKPLIDQSTLVKIEGQITIHAKPETTTEGFVFVMPEVHPAVTGFEMMLRFLFPVFDTFALYGRPGRLIAETLDQRGLMFAMPRDRRYGYLDILDVSGLIHTEGSQNWTERQWRSEMKKLTSHRMNSVDLRASPRRSTLTSRTSLNLGRSGGVRFSEDGVSSSPTTRRGSPVSVNENIQFAPPRRTGTAPAQASSPSRGHQRSSSDAIGYKRFQSETPSRLAYESYGIPNEYDEYPPEPPLHGGVYGEQRPTHGLERVLSETEPYEETPPTQSFEELKLQADSPRLAPVQSPPRFEHTPNSKPAKVPLAPQGALQRANSAMDAATLHQLADATGHAPQMVEGQMGHGRDTREVANVANHHHPRKPADASVLNEGMVNRYAGSSAYNARLTTIPASPYNPNPPYGSSDHGSPPPVPTHRDVETPSNEAPYSPVLQSPSSHRSISRKPVPSRVLSPHPAEQYAALINDPPSPSDTGSLRDELMDHAVLQEMLAQASLRSPSPVPEDDPIIEDDESVDYSSEKAVSPPPKPVNRPRAGKLKTVGNPDLVPTEQTMSELDPARASPAEKINPSEYPTIDFGPTLIYKPNARPSTGGSMTTPGSLPREVEAPVEQAAARSTSRLSMMDKRRSSYFESPRKKENRRSIAWQPVASTPTEGLDEGLTPEQWVQHRASIASQPWGQPRPGAISSHKRRQSSTNLLRSTSKTPPLSRPPSGDWSRQLRATSKTPPLSRVQSGDWTNQMPGRPQSRTAGAHLNPPSPGNVLVNTQAPHLSAREQMHVARATGSPMLGLTGKDRNKMEDCQAPGLIGAVAAREREKEAIKEGMRSSMVQQEIVRRQQEQVQADMEAQMQAQLQAQQIAQQQAQAYQQQLQAQQKAQAQALAYQQQLQQQQQAQVYQMQLQQQQQQQPVNMYGSRPASMYSMSGGQGWGYAAQPQQQQQQQQQSYGGQSVYGGQSYPPQQNDLRQQQQQQQQWRRYQ